MADEIDELAALGSKPKGPRPKLDTQIRSSARVIAKVTDDKMMAGKYKRQQILLPPAQLQYIAGKAAELGMSQQAFYRWLIDYALAAVEQGERPEVTTRTVLGEAVKRHWTSE
jgi:hypothetical protein